MNNLFNRNACISFPPFNFLKKPISHPQYLYSILPLSLKEMNTDAKHSKMYNVNFQNTEAKLMRYY